MAFGSQLWDSLNPCSRYKQTYATCTQPIRTPRHSFAPRSLLFDHEAVSRSCIVLASHASFLIRTCRVVRTLPNGIRVFILYSTKLPEREIKPTHFFAKDRYHNIHAFGTSELECQSTNNIKTRTTPSIHYFHTAFHVIRQKKKEENNKTWCSRS